MKETYLDKAVTNYNAAIKLYDSNSKEFANIIAFCIQQSIEFGVKYIYNRKRIICPKTHDIGFLINSLPNHFRHFVEDIEDFQKTISIWYKSFRYKKGYKIDLVTLNIILTKIELFIRKLKRLY